MAQLKLLGARLALRPDGKDEATKSGIILPEKAQEENFMGTVVAVGPGARLEDGTTFPMEVQIGDRLMYSRLAGVPVTVNNEELLIINEAHIVAIFPKEKSTPQPSDYWLEHEDYPSKDWIYQVSDKNTRLGYWDWVKSCQERDDADEPQES